MANAADHQQPVSARTVRASCLNTNGWAVADDVDATMPNQELASRGKGDANDQ